MRGMFFHFPTLLSVTCACGKMCVAAALFTLGTMGQPQDATSETTAAPKSGSVRKAITGEALREQMEEALKAKAQRGPIGKPVDPSRVPTQASPFSRSLILGDANIFTLLPLGAILHLPPDHRSKLIAQPGEFFLAWPNFLKQNSVWLTTREVSVKMASGQDPKFAERVVRELASETRVVIAVRNGNPVSIMEPEPSKKELKIQNPNVGGSRLAPDSSLPPRQ
jgi:hypothetical protein